MRARGWTSVLVVAAAGYAAAAAAERALRDLGATADERARSLPGDEVVPDAHHQATNAVTIAAPPAAVWPWLVQMGCGRAGWYSFDLLDNGGHPSARRIHPEWQRLSQGDVVPNAPGGATGFTVERLEPERLLVYGRPVEVDTGRTLEGPGFRGAIAWAFVLEGLEGDLTRLIVRTRAGGSTPPAEAPVRLFWSIAHIVMQQRQLREIRRRAESGP